MNFDYYVWERKSPVEAEKICWKIHICCWDIDDFHSVRRVAQEIFGFFNYINYFNNRYNWSASTVPLDLCDHSSNCTASRLKVYLFSYCLQGYEKEENISSFNGVRSRSISMEKGIIRKGESNKQEHKETQTRLTNDEGGGQNWSVTPADEDMWECGNASSNKAIWLENLSSGTLRKKGNQKQNIQRHRSDKWT